VFIVLIFFIIVAAICELIFLYTKKGDKRAFWLMSKGYAFFLASLVSIGFVYFDLHLLDYLKFRLDGLFVFGIFFLILFALIVTSLGFLIASCALFGSSSALIVKNTLLSVLFAVSHIAIALTSYVILGFFVFVLAALGG
jgi:hypothetical protein